jgi:hypothetical protein
VLRGMKRLGPLQDLAVIGVMTLRFSLKAAATVETIYA